MKRSTGKSGGLKSKLISPIDSGNGEHRKITQFVDNARKQVEQELREKEEESHISHVHTYSDLRIQAFLLSIPSLQFPLEILLKTKLVYLSHRFDDSVDQPRILQTVQEVIAYKDDPKQLLHLFGNVGKYIASGIETCPFPEAVYLGFQRIAYGSMFINTGIERDLEAFLEEYKRISFNGLDRDVQSSLETISPLSYALTSKTVQEIWFGCETAYNRTLAELWTLLFTPGVLFHDIDEEKEAGELYYSHEYTPPIRDINKMIEIAEAFLPNYEDSRIKQRHHQLQCFIKAFRPVLPDSTYRAYENLEQQLQKRV